jgi:hypothetical protein
MLIEFRVLSIENEVILDRFEHSVGTTDIVAAIADLLCALRDALMHSK